MLFQKVKRNPLFLSIAGLVLVAALVFAWWTISPLFIRTTLVEGQNIAVPETDSSDTMAATSIATATTTTSMADNDAMTTTASATPTSISMSDTAESMAEPTMAPKPEEKMEPMGPVVLATGNFDRKDSVHYANGQAILAREADGSHVIRLQDLDAANGPDLYVYVSEHPNPQTGDELHVGEHNLGSLKATNGSFSYTLDPMIDPTRIKSVVIYCKAFSVLFSTAALQASQ